MQDGLGMQLANPGFGKIKDHADFLHGHLIVIVKGNNEFFLWREGLDHLLEPVLELFSDKQIQRIALFNRLEALPRRRASRYNRESDLPD